MKHERHNRSFAQDSPSAYGSSNMDIANEIIRLCNRAYPAKAAVPATKPGAATPRLSDSLSNPCGKEEAKSNLALYQYRPPPGVELRVPMLFGRVIVGPADPASKASRLLFIVSHSRVKSLLGQDCKGEPVHCYLPGPDGSTKCNITVDLSLRPALAKPFRLACGRDVQAQLRGPHSHARRYWHFLWRVSVFFRALRFLLQKSRALEPAPDREGCRGSLRSS